MLMKFSKKINGFSILEVVIFLFVISLLSATVVVGYGAFNKKMERQSIDEIVSNLNLAKKLAIAKNKAVLVKKTVTDGDDALAFYIGNNIKYKDLKLYKSLKITSFKTVKFNASGIPSQGLTILIRNNKNKLYSITVLPATGKINLYIDNEWVK